MSLAVGILGGLALGGALPSAQPALGLLLLGLGSMLAVAGLRVPAQPIRAAVLAAVLGLLLGAALGPEPGPPLLGTREVTAEVRRLDDEGVTLSDPLDRRIRLRATLAPGTTVHLRAELRPRVGFRNSSPHVAWPTLGPAAYAHEVRALQTLSPPSPYRAVVNAIQARVTHALRSSLSVETAGVARALVLGEGAAVPDETAAAIRGAGLSHVLAVSGMHVTLVVGALWWALRRMLLALPRVASRYDVRRLASALSVPLALFYADVAGSTPSAWRAAITSALAWTLVAAGRRPSAISTTAGASVILCVIDPGAALSPGFVLSIAATAAIVAPRSQPNPQGVSTGPADLLRVSLRAFIATAPFTLYVFGGLSWLAVLANLVVVPIGSALLLPAALLHALIASADVSLGALSAPLVELLSSAFVGASEAFAGASPSARIPPPSLEQGVVLALAALALLTQRPPRDKAIVLALLALGYAGLEARLRSVEQPTGVLRVSYLDVGQGDAAVLDLPDGSLMLIDVGGAPNGGPDPGEHAVVPLLRARRRSVVDWLVITHPHPDHYGGLAALSQDLMIREVWDSGQGHAEHAEGELAAMLDGLVARGTRLRRPSSLCGPPRSVGGVLIEVLWPCPGFDPGYDPNDNSLVLRVRFGRRTFLFAGDAEAHAEASIAGRVGSVDVLKVGHHGSRTSSSEALLRELHPALAIVSSGLGNRFGHPHAEVVSRLGRSANATLRTDLEGGIMVTTDGSRLWADTFSGRHLRVSPDRDR